MYAQWSAPKPGEYGPATDTLWGMEAIVVVLLVLAGLGVAVGAFWMVYELVRRT